MTTPNLSEASSTLFKLLEPLSQEERQRVITSVLILLGDPAPVDNLGGKQSGGLGGAGGNGKRDVYKDDAKSYFELKKPTQKNEELAVAARFLELQGTPAPHKKEDFSAVFTQARRNFAPKNFLRDINNAITGGYFNSGGGSKTGFTLSYYGQNYVDHLPDRDAVATLHKPKKGMPKKKAAAPRKAPVKK